MLTAQEQNIIQALKQRDLNSFDTLDNLLAMAINVTNRDPENREYAFSITKFVKAKAQQNLMKDPQLYEQLYWKSLLFEAPYLFDSYMLYLEKDRQPYQRFYQPRRKQLLKHGLIDALQDLADGKLKMLSISVPPGCGKTTLEKFFVSWIMGKYPDDYNIFFSHSGDITRMFYDSVLDITTNGVEYKWANIFPNVILEGTNAKAETINFNKYKPFANLQCSSLNSNNSGKIRASKFIFCDDLIGKLEQALNRNQLDKIWQTYAVDLRQRKLNKEVRELIIGTRWSVHDHIGRLERMYEGDPQVKFIAVPDIDPETGESNFDYTYNGMSVEFFNDQAKLMDEISYQCLYKNKPIEREGLLYDETTLRRYHELPQKEPEEIVGQCDTKAKGTDFMFMPIFYRYGQDYYLVDCVCSNSADYEVQYESLANAIVNYGVQSVEFESNAGGDRVAKEVNKRVLDKGWVCNITDKPTEKNKEAKIYQCAAWIKSHILFRSKDDYAPKSDYAKMMEFLLCYSILGKNEHDDVPDCLANFALCKTALNQGARVEVISNPFRSMYGGNQGWW